MTRFKNDAGIFGARMGRVSLMVPEGKKTSRKASITSVFTHRNPKTGDVYGEDIPTRSSDGNIVIGRWVPSSDVEWF